LTAIKPAWRYGIARLAQEAEGAGGCLIKNALVFLKKDQRFFSGSASVCYLSMPAQLHVMMFPFRIQKCGVTSGATGAIGAGATIGAGRITPGRAAVARVRSDLAV
jgi:hypothetical protein